MRNRFQSRLRESTTLKALKILPAEDQKKVIWVALIQVCLGFLDLLGVAALGVVGALSVTGVQSQQPGNRVGAVLRELHLINFSFQAQVAFLAVGAAVILILRTIFSIIVTRRTYYFLSRRSALITSSLFSRLLSQSLLKIQEKSSQETLYSLTVGVSSLTLIVLGTSVALVADISLTIIMFLGLLLVDPLIAILTLIFFGSLGLSLYKLTSVRAHRLGYLDSELTVASNNMVLEVLGSYRESVVRNRRSYYTGELRGLRLKVSDVAAEMQFMPNVSKYVIESGMVVGAVIIAGTQFALQDARHAVAALSVFLAAGTRIAPAIMRIQQNLIQVRRGIGSAMPTLQMIESLSSIEEKQIEIDSLDIVHSGFNSKIEVEHVSLTYPGADQSALADVNLRVESGKSLAIVGPSGAGKTSLVDVILGVIPTSTGQINISGKTPLEAISSWPGAIAYVPQNVLISDGTIRSNVALGFPSDVAIDELVWRALEVAQLSDFVRSLPGGLDAHVGENGTKISGGQRQRLGIARAMFTQPKLLVLDEATSSLDGQTESDISSSLAKLQGEVTLVMIAHRLSTIREAGEVIYMDNGKILARGTFDQVRNQVPDFENQAQLMGL
jgi:ABC-type multidrug transport system fused ATPase/permease subunit